ncbi:MAG: DUF1360 domain-containing protein [Solirubrobacterales bacterium]|nr:DUF1360 domain-containing protein [Solirubrobacterales bacterium]
MSGHSPAQYRPLASYRLLTSVYLGLCAAFATWLRHSRRGLPKRPAGGDLALGAVATHKAARMIAHDRVTSGLRAPFTVFQGDDGPGEVDEAARGRGLRRALGELLVCPYCLGMWIATTFVVGLLIAPRATRWTASAFVIVTGSDLLQIAYKKAEDLL